MQDYVDPQTSKKANLVADPLTQQAQKGNMRLHFILNQYYIPHVLRKIINHLLHRLKIFPHILAERRRQWQRTYYANMSAEKEKRVGGQK